LGPAGTFTEAAALRYDPQATCVPYPTIAAAVAAVEKGEADEAVAPIENSIEGAVAITLDLLVYSPLRIRAEVLLPITHCLVAPKHVRLPDVALVYSHPQALAQCRRYLEANMPKAKPVASLSTAAAVEDARKAAEPAVAIATRRAAELQGATILAEGIQDSATNTTRFVVLGREDSPHTGDDKTSLAFTFSEDRPGLLYAAMGAFASRGINLSRVESRPTGEALGRYVFLVDLIGHRADAKVVDALAELSKLASNLKVLGSYPRWREGK
jgi:prephenate dehydratase